MTTTMRSLVIEDDRKITSFVTSGFRQSGSAVLSREGEGAIVALTLPAS